jgi:hypothetical protein
MTNSDDDVKGRSHNPKVSKTVAIIVIALAPLIGAGTAEGHGFAGGFGNGFHAGALAATVFMAGMAAVLRRLRAWFIAGMVAFIRAAMSVAIPGTVTTATNRVQLTAYISSSCWERNTSAWRCRPILNPPH